MNESTNPEQNLPIESAVERSSSAPNQQPLYWLRRFLACNPFYLVSVATLLYGCYRVSLEPKLFNNEVAHLYFNFSSLQVYELLLVATAILLARRKIWYDSTMLVGLENLLLFVPFILISQAGLIDGEMLRWMCIAGGLLALGRLNGLKRFAVRLNFPVRSVVLGVSFIAVNVALPIIYRILHESKFGTKLESGAAYYTNESVWLMLLPILCVSALLIPRAGTVRYGVPPSGGQRWTERPWLPIGLFGLWLAGTVTHLYCLGYVYDFDLRGALIAPGALALSWVLYARAADFVPVLTKAWRRSLLLLPMLAPLAAWSPSGSKLFMLLMLVNSGLYFRLFFNNRGNRLALHLGVVSVAAMVAGFPESWTVGAGLGWNRGVWVSGAGAAWFLLWAVRARNPQFGLLGAVIAAVMTLLLLGQRLSALHWAAQVGFAFLLLHSLRWIDSEHSGAALVRLLAAAGWVAHAVVWVETGGAFWMPCATGVVVLGIYFVVRAFGTASPPRAVLFGALAVILSGPADAAIGKVQTVPIGILAVTGSFLLFGLGTAVALTRHRWHKDA